MSSLNILHNFHTSQYENSRTLSARTVQHCAHGHWSSNIAGDCNYLNQSLAEWWHSLLGNFDTDNDIIGKFN